MYVTTADLQRFVGGQMEIQNPGAEYLYRSEIASIEISHSDLVARFTWSAKGESYPVPKRWIKDEELSYSATCRSVHDLGTGETGGNRLILQTYSGETVVLYPPDGSKLDRSKVEGLDTVGA